MRRIWRSVLDGIAPYDAGTPLEVLTQEVGLPALVRLSANENPLGPSPAVVDVIRREASRVHLYPDGGSQALREALGRKLGIAPGQIVIGNGADELLALLAWAAFDRGDEVIVPDPSFEPYTTVVTLAGAVVRPSPLAGYDTDLDDMRRRVTDRTKAIMICSPHNPAATIVRRTPLLRFLASLGDDPPLVVLDEAYRDFVDDPEYPDGASLLAQFPRLVVLRTFSKIAGLAGLRVGYALGGVDTADRLNRVRAPYNVNRLGQAAALAALEDHGYLERTRQVVLEERRFLTDALTRSGVRFAPSQANFLLVEVGDSREMRGRLLGAGLVVRDGAGVGFPGHLRISIGLRETNERLLAVLAGPDRHPRRGERPNDG
jgi:histidinol-phosphate aminotransferase